MSQFLQCRVEDVDQGRGEEGHRFERLLAQGHCGDRTQSVALKTLIREKIKVRGRRKGGRADIGGIATEFEERGRAESLAHSQRPSSTNESLLKATISQDRPKSWQD